MNNTFKFKKIVEHKAFDIFMLLVILLNSFTVIAGFIDQNQDRQFIYDGIDYYLVIIYIIEFICKIMAMGVLGYFRDNWNKLDFTLIVISLSTDFAFSMFKLVRTARTARATRMARTVRFKRSTKLIRTFRSLRVVFTLISASKSLRLAYLFL